MWRCVFFIWFLTFQDNKQQHLQVHQQMSSNWIINHSWNKVTFKHVKSLIFYLLRFISASFKGSFFLICKQVCRICFSLLSFIISVFFKRLLVCFALTSFKPFRRRGCGREGEGAIFPSTSVYHWFMMIQKLFVYVINVNSKTYALNCN